MLPAHTMSSVPICFLVIESHDGETLAQRLEKGPFPFRQLQAAVHSDTSMIRVART